MNPSIVFVSKNKRFIKIVRKLGYKSHYVEIQDYVPEDKNTFLFYISPGDKHGYMDKDINYNLSQYVFPKIEPIIKRNIHYYGELNEHNEKYLPIGSSMIINYDDKKSLVYTPTDDTGNLNVIYYAIISVLINIMKKELDIKYHIILPDMLSYLHLPEEEIVKQIERALSDYNKYNYKTFDKDIIMVES